MKHASKSRKRKQSPSAGESSFSAVVSPEIKKPVKTVITVLNSHFQKYHPHVVNSSDEIKKEEAENRGEIL